MSQPPEEVPEGLSAREYQRLIALYTLMGRHNHAAKAFSRLSENDQKLQAAGLRESMLSDEPEASNQGSPASDSASGGNDAGASASDAGASSNDAGANASGIGESEKSLVVGPHDQYVLGHQAGANFAQALLKLLQQLTIEAVDKNDKLGTGADLRQGLGQGSGQDSRKNSDRDSGRSSGQDSGQDSGSGDDSDNDEPLTAMKEQLLSIGLSEDEAQEYVQKLRQALADMTQAEPPPRELPEDLTAEEYWQLAVRYKQVGWTEQARDALTTAIELDGDGPVGIKCRSFLRSKIPRYPVPLMAEQLNIQGYNQMFVNESEAQRMFENLVKDYPDFEWPYGNLGSLLIKRGRLEKAQELLVKAVQINPYYINGWLHLSRVYAIQENFSAAEDCLQRVTAIDASDPNWKGIRDLVEQLKSDFEEN
ncbi:MAG: tetratricopeptide repeat protein [Candidatus Obscuribacterales bacterium]